jgi:4-amino-4-deoxy-L-arabinose transferase-like glycosyltransferase
VTGLVLGAVTAAGLVARLLLIGEPMRFDESYAFVHDVSHSIHHIATSYPFPGGHFAHSLAAHAVLKVFGDHLWTARVPALLAGVALIPAVFLAARNLYDERGALWAAALTAGFAPLVDYSVNGRAYILGALMTITALWLATRLLDGHQRVRDWAAFGACCVVAVYCVPTFAFAVATVSGWLAAVAYIRRDFATLRRLPIALGAAAGLALLLYWPTFGQTGWDYAKAMSRRSGSLADVAERVWSHWSRATPDPLVWLVAAGFLISLVLHRRIARHPVPVAAVALAIPLLATVLNRAGPFERSWLYLLPLYLVHAGSGLSYVADRALRRAPRPALANGVAAIAIAIGLGAAAVDHGETDPTQLPSSDNDIVGFLKRGLRPGEAAVLDPASVGPASDYYLARYRYLPPPLPRAGAPTTALLVVRRREGGVSGVRRLVRSIDWRLVPGAAPPRLVGRLEYVEAWEARIERRGAGLSRQ